MNIQPLTNEKISEQLSSLPGWSHQEGQLVKSFEFKDFRAAISFIVRLAFHAEELNHHPNLTNVYNQVVVALTTHDAGSRVTPNDVELARAIEGFSWV